MRKSNKKHNPLIAAIATGDTRKLEEAKQVAQGKKVIISSYYDLVKFKRTKRSNEVPEIIIQDPFRSVLEQMLKSKTV